jgi:hypothetical protein
VLRNAALITGVTPTICREVREEGHAPVALVPNFLCDDPDWSHRSSTETVLPPFLDRSIAYMGSLSYGRATVLRSVVRAIRRVNNDTNRKIQLVYFGPHEELVRQIGDAERANDEVRAYGTRDRWTARLIASKAMLNLVLTTTGYEYMVPAKFYEYLASRRPILVIGPPHNDCIELAKFVEDIYTAPLSSEYRIAEAIKEFLPRASHSSVRSVDSLSVQTILLKLDQYLRTIVRGSQLTNSQCDASWEELFKRSSPITADGVPTL